MQIKKGGGKWLLVALLAGTVAGAICIMFGANPVIANAIPFGVSAGVFVATRDKWQA
ncbi:hypothetical protein [Pseudoalteromonas sp. SR41-6]|jgi:hypothetical protein|uniref:hypothetical protein n=1 Tax=Pseudoalteromonas sp. SR41-6 TaxID=2760948 RepID=UPI001602E7D4|nr:hypothetical protein [Pseudoalteromonas sp. SR41-6]MBB1333961.1 hypothetical protein [Pseudoalteromonas sp. SR41-6]|tara:strand:- start:622 stop:792 length:171 start_codon:yes stop_codon:yes gene_type:complete